MEKGTNTDFREYLRGELVRRCKANPKYSLRAFAKALRVGPSFLSMLLNAQRPITSSFIRRAAPRLSVSPVQLEGFLSSIDTRSMDRAPTDSPILKYRQIAMDHFQIIAEWYHYAILELVAVRDFKPDYRWVSKTMGVSITEIKAAVERLKRVGLLEVDKNGRWINTNGNNTNLDNAMVAVARRSLQKQILEKAIYALEEIPFENRDQSSMTLAIDRKLLSEARKKITEFRRSLIVFL